MTKFVKLYSKRLLSMLIVLILLLGIGFSQGLIFAFPEDEVFEIYVFGNKSKGDYPAPFVATSGILKEKGTLTLSSNPKIITCNADGYPSGNGFDDGELAWLMAISTEGYANITIKECNMRSSSGAPRDFKVFASLDGKVWEDIAQCKKLPDGEMIKVLSDVKLPSTYDNQKTVYLKWAMSSAVSAGNSSISTTGTNRFGATVITAIEYRPEGMPRKVVSDIKSGEVPKGKVVTLSCEKGSIIKYSVNGGVENVTTTDSVEVAIDTFIGEKKECVITAKSFNNIMESYVATFTYTQAELYINSSVPTGRMITPTRAISFVATYAEATVQYQITYRYGKDDATTEGWANYTKPLLFADKASFPILIATKADAAGGYLASPTILFLYHYSDNLEVFNLYYGQLHSHTGDSDGTGTVSGAYDYADNIADVDFLAVTDHSNYFDTKNDSKEVNTTADKWVKGLQAAKDATDEEFVGLYGYEMTWSGGPGHMNTYNCNGFVSRNSSIYNNKTNDIGLQEYYKLLTTEAMRGSVSAFNHPGKTFGTFSDYAYYNPLYDEMITMIEVGNGEGEVGSGMYFRSYEEYWKALDKGWHVAPTNNGDNHQGKWGNSNTARTVILSTELTAEGLYKALRNMRVYSTEEADLQIDYRLNGNAMGSILYESDIVDDINITAKIVNPSGTNIKRVSVIVNGGKEIGVVDDIGKSSYDYTLNCKAGEYTYFYLKVELENDHLAVTAPVWVGEVEKIGISSFESDTFMPVKGEEMNLSVTIFNNETENLIIDSVEFRKGDYPIGILGESIVPQGKLMTFSIGYAPTFAGETKFEVHITGHIGTNVRKYFTSFKTTVRDGATLKTIGIDAAHQNDYVAGNYKNSITNFAEMAGTNGARVVMLRQITAQTLANVDALILTPPSRRESKIDLDGNPTKLQSYLPEELTAIKDWLVKDKVIIICGLADYSDKKITQGMDTTPYHAAYQMNLVLDIIGANTQIEDDEVLDDKNHSGDQAFRLKFKNYNMDSPYLKGVNPAQEYSFYSGCSVKIKDETKVETLVSTWDTSYTIDSDRDKLGGDKVPSQRPVLTVETLANGATVFTAGSAFMSNFEVSVQMDNATTLPYSNSNICFNIIRKIAPPQPKAISEIKMGLEGEIFTVQGIVTSNASGYDRETAFFDCIYIQDNSGGLNLFPVSGNYCAGDLIMATGKVSSYNGEVQMEVTSTELIQKEFSVPNPKKMSAEEASLKENVGWLAKVEGIVSKVTFKENLLESFVLDGKALVWLDGYITPGVDLNWIKNGMTVSVEGLTSMTANKESGERFISRIRIADRNTIKFIRGALTTPTLVIESMTKHAITIKAVPGAEYSIDKGKTWHDSNVFTDLDPNTNYICVIRMKATENENASSPSEFEIVTTKSKAGTVEVILIVSAVVVVAGGGVAVTLVVLKKKGKLKGKV
ncbi:MAG: CehA/McbA family metallohydrolase [Clostridia bacterium]